MSTEASGGGGCGCVSIIVFFVLVWFLLFGLTWGGTHYSMSCSTDDGVVIHTEEK